mgnify:CR=1 FL=1
MKKNLYTYLAGNEYPARHLHRPFAGRHQGHDCLLDHGPQRQQPQPRV